MNVLLVIIILFQKQIFEAVESYYFVEKGAYQYIVTLKNLNYTHMGTGFLVSPNTVWSTRLVLPSGTIHENIRKACPKYIVTTAGSSTYQGAYENSSIQFVFNCVPLSNVLKLEFKGSPNLLEPVKQLSNKFIKKMINLYENSAGMCGMLGWYPLKNDTREAQLIYEPFTIRNSSFCHQQLCVLQNVQCERKWKVTFCAESNEKSRSCFVDFGSPLLCESKLLGFAINSQTKLCTHPVILSIPNFDKFRNASILEPNNYFQPEDDASITPLTSDLGSGNCICSGTVEKLPISFHLLIAMLFNKFK